MDVKSMPEIMQMSIKFRRCTFSDPLEVLDISSDTARETLSHPNAPHCQPLRVRGSQVGVVAFEDE